MGWRGVDWIDLTKARDWWRAPVNTVMNLRALCNVVNFLSGCTTGGLLIGAHHHALCHLQDQ
jgi:hypothetical protein